MTKTEKLRMKHLFIVLISAFILASLLMAIKVEFRVTYPAFVDSFMYIVFYMPIVVVMILCVRMLYIITLLPASIILRRSFRCEKYGKNLFLVTLSLIMSFLLSLAILIFMVFDYYGVYVVKTMSLHDILFKSVITYYVYPVMIFYLVSLCYPVFLMAIYRKLKSTFVLKFLWCLSIILIEIVVFFSVKPDGLAVIQHFEWGIDDKILSVATMFDFILKWILFSVPATLLIIRKMENKNVCE